MFATAAVEASRLGGCDPTGGSTTEPRSARPCRQDGLYATLAAARLRLPFISFACEQHLAMGAHGRLVKAPNSGRRRAADAKQNLAPTVE
jgi:hypothetical protein